MKWQIKNQRKKGFTLIEIMIVVLIIGILLAIALPNFIKARDISQNNSCLSNLKAIESAKEQLALANMKSNGSDVQWSDIVPSFIRTQPYCPAGGVYTLHTIGEKTDCNIIGHALP